MSSVADMSKIQPAMFSLQASEKEMGQLIPQLLQMPLFRPGDPGTLNLMESFDEDDDESFLTVRHQDEALANGNVRVAIPVDTAIYTLLRSHCAKGARQAEESINTAMRSTYIPNFGGTFSAMPPIVKFNSEHRRNSSFSSNGNGSSSQLTPDTIRGMSSAETLTKVSSSSISTDECSTTHSSKLSTHSSISMHTSYGSLPGSEASETNLTTSESVTIRSVTPTARTDTLSPLPQQQPSMQLTSANTTANSNVLGRSITPTPRSNTLPPPHPTVVRSPSADIATLRRDSGKGDSESSITTPKHKALEKTFSASKARKTSTVLQPPVLPPQSMAKRRSREDSMDSEISLSDSLRCLGPNRWNTSILENNTIVTQYGDAPYPIVWWEPGFKVDFRLSSSVGLLSGTVMGIDPRIPEVTLKVFNNSPRQIGFAIRSHRQSSVYSSHVVFPKKGLQVLAPHKTWEDNVEFCSNTPSTAEMFVIDLFFCTMDSKPVWNIVRKYAIMKAQKR